MTYKDSAADRTIQPVGHGLARKWQSLDLGNWLEVVDTIDSEEEDEEAYELVSIYYGSAEDYGELPIASSSVWSSTSERIQQLYEIRILKKLRRRFGPPIVIHRKLRTKDFSIGERLGRGHFGSVYYGKFGKREVAMKKLRDQQSQNIEETIHEAHLLSLCNHEGVVKLEGVIVDSTPYYIVTGYMENGDLRRFVASHSDISLHSLLNIIKQITNAMVHLTCKSRRIIHRDLAARNILVGSYNPHSPPVVKVADFGLAIQLKVGQELHIPKKGQRCSFALRWSANEVITHSVFSYKSDVWAFAMVIYEIMSQGKTPFRDFNTKREIEKMIILEDSSTYPMVEELSKISPGPLVHLVKLCWSKDSRDRPTFTDIVEFLEREF